MQGLEKLIYPFNPLYFSGLLYLCGLGSTPKKVICSTRSAELRSNSGSPGCVQQRRSCKCSLLVVLLAMAILFWPSCGLWPISQDVGLNGSLHLHEIPSPECVCPCSDGKHPEPAHTLSRLLSILMYLCSRESIRGCMGTRFILINTLSSSVFK